MFPVSIRVDDIRTELLPELVELAGDEDSSVRLAAFDTIINMMEMIDSGESLVTTGGAVMMAQSTTL